MQDEQRGQGAQEGHGRAWWRTFAVAYVVWALLAGTWAVASPLFSVPDEPAHVMRAASVVSGQLLGDRRDFSSEGPPEVRAIMHIVDVPAGLAGIGGYHNCFAPAKGTADCADPLPAQAGTAEAATTAGAYQPLFYALVGAPTAVLTPVQGVYASRLLHVLIGAAFLAAATAVAWQLGGRILLAATVLAVTPVAPYLIGSVNPNGTEIASALALWLAVPAFVVRPDRRLAGLIVASTVILAWSRPLSPVIAGGIVVVGVLLAIDRERWAALRGSRATRLAGVGVLAAISSASIWVLATGALTSFVAYPDPSLTGSVAARASWNMGWYRLEQLVGVLGWLDTPLPGALVLTWGLAALAIGLVALWVGTRRQRGLVLAMALGSVVLPVIAETLSAAEMGLIWQGRYTLPVAMGYLVVSGWTLASSDAAWLRSPITSLGAVALAGFCAAAHVVTHLVSMSRYATGPESPLLDYLGQEGWTTPLPDGLLLAVVVLAALSLPALVLLGGDTPLRPLPVGDGAGRKDADHPA